MATRVRFELVVNFGDDAVEEVDAAAREWLRYQYGRDGFDERAPGERAEQVVVDVVQTELLDHDAVPLGGVVESSHVEVLT